MTGEDLVIAHVILDGLWILLVVRVFVQTNDNERTKNLRDHREYFFHYCYNCDVRQLVALGGWIVSPNLLEFVNVRNWTFRFRFMPL